MSLDTCLVPLPSLGLVKMEDRKRPAFSDQDDTAPPSKRQAISSATNGAKLHADADVPFKDEIEVCCSKDKASASPVLPVGVLFMLT